MTTSSHRKKTLPMHRRTEWCHSSFVNLHEKSCMQVCFYLLCLISESRLAIHTSCNDSLKISHCVWYFRNIWNSWTCHRVLRLQLTYLKNPRTVKHAFFGVKPHGEQCLLKALCPLWENPCNDFEKKPFGLLNKVLEGR